jgi:hypothetical protein
LAVLIVAGGAAVGDERTERAFRAMFAADLERVAETSSLDDDVALAARMVRVARAGRADTALLETLCEHALTLVETAESGRSVARDAEDLLIETSPELAAALWARRAETLKRRLATAPRQQRTRIAEQLVDVLLSLADVQSGSGRGGDAEATLSEAAAVASTGARHRQSQIESARTRLAARIAATDELERALRRLESDPSDSQVCRRVVELYVIMMDDPASAAEYVDQAGDEVLATYVPLAAAPVSTIPAAAAMELGQWYLQLAADADAIWQRALLRRAQRSLASAGGEQELARALLADVEADLAFLDGQPIERGDAEDLLGSIDLGQDVVSGLWRQGRDTITVEAGGRTALELPIALGGSYTLELRVARTAGNAGLLIVLPIHGRHVALVIDHDGKTGLMQVDGKGLVPANPTYRQARRLPADRPFNVTVSVQWSQFQTGIRATAGGRPIVDFAGEVADLSLPPEMTFQTRRIAIGTLGSGAAFGAVGVRIVDGEARWARPQEGP